MTSLNEEWEFLELLPLLLSEFKELFFDFFPDKLDEPPLPLVVLFLESSLGVLSIKK